MNAQFRQRIFHYMNLIFETGMGNIHYMNQQIGLAYFI